MDSTELRPKGTKLAFRNVLQAVVGLCLLTVTWALFRTVRRFVDVDIIADSEIGVRFICKSSRIDDLRTKQALVHFQAEIVDASVRDVRFRIQSAHEDTSYEYDFPVDQLGLVLGTIPLGSERWPVREDEAYLFELVDFDNQRLAYGRLAVRVTELPFETRWAFWIGLIASILQIGQFARSIFLARTAADH